MAKRDWIPPTPIDGPFVYKYASEKDLEEWRKREEEWERGRPERERLAQESERRFQAIMLEQKRLIDERLELERLEREKLAKELAIRREYEKARREHNRLERAADKERNPSEWDGSREPFVEDEEYRASKAAHMADVDWDAMVDRLVDALQPGTIPAMMAANADLLRMSGEQSYSDLHAFLLRRRDSARRQAHRPDLAVGTWHTELQGLDTRFERRRQLRALGE